MAGRIGPQRTCEGTTYSNPYGIWQGVVVQAIVKITLKSYSATVRLSDNKIILQSGQQWQSGHCFDNEDGHTYWEPAPNDYCKFQNYDVIYDGRASKVTAKSNDEQKIYLVSTEDTIFALTRTRQSSLCGFILVQTKHPKLFFLEVEPAGKFKSRSPVPVNNLDIFTYVNFKFVYVEKHLKRRILQLYKDIMRQKCDIENQVLKNGAP